MGLKVGAERRWLWCFSGLSDPCFVCLLWSSSFRDVSCAHNWRASSRSTRSFVRVKNGCCASSLIRSLYFSFLSFVPVWLWEKRKKRHTQGFETQRRRKIIVGRRRTVEYKQATQNRVLSRDHFSIKSVDCTGWLLRCSRQIEPKEMKKVEYS